MYKVGFAPLEEELGRKIIFGLVGQFWKPAVYKAPLIHDPEAFLAFDGPAYAKAATNFFVSERDECTYCSNETRVHASGPFARRNFAFYWQIISMDSALIRVLWLKAIKHKAETG